MPTTTEVEKQQIVREFSLNFPQLEAVEAEAPRPRADEPNFSSVLLKESRYPQYHEIERMTLLYVRFMMQLDQRRNSKDSPISALDIYVRSPPPPKVKIWDWRG
jgi:hypothetical protein